MNTKKISLALVSVFALVGLASCSQKGKEPGQEATVTSMKLNSGFRTAYMTGETIDWTKVSVTVAYSDSSSATFTGNKVEFDVETPAESTSLVVYTSGLHAQATAQEGEYAITAALAGKTQKFDLANVVVGKIVPSKYDLVSFDIPDFVETYKSAKESAGQSGESNFYQGSELFTVGTLNVFEFEPVATFMNKETREIVPSTNYKKVTSVKVKSASAYVDADTNDYKVVDGGVKFNDSAAGKQFKLTVFPQDFETVLEDPVTPAEMEFKVERGFNVYEAKELGILNVTSHSSEWFYDNPFSSHIGVKNGLTQTADTDNVFWDADHSTYTYLDTTAVWREFLVDTGTFTAEELNTIHDVPAVFFMEPITLMPEDIPDEYFVVDGETGNTGVNHDGRTGSLRDAAVIFHPIVDDQDITVNGNYFTLDVHSISLCNSTWKNGLTCYTGNETNVDPGHASLFKFNGRYQDRDTYHQNQVDLSNGHKGIVKNVNTLGNTVKNVATDDIMQVTGLIFAKNVACGGEYTNNIIKQYQIGVFPDHFVGQTQNQDATREEDAINTRVTYTKIYDCSNSGICNYRNGGTYVAHCQFDRYGGAPILNAGGEDAYNSGITFFGEDVEFNNFITGAEVYFVAVGAAGQFSQLSAFNMAFNAYGKSIVKDGKMNLVELNMDGDSYVASSHRNYYGDVYLNYGSEKELKCTVGDATNPAWQFYQYLLSATGGSGAPVFATEKGSPFYYTGEQYNPEEGKFPFKNKEQSPEFLIQGDYVSILLPVGGTTLNATFRLYDAA